MPKVCRCESQETDQPVCILSRCPKLDAAAKEQRLKVLTDAARRCVARGGYRNLSVDDVCAEAGLSKGAFYTYFDQKQDLLVALMDDDAAGLNDVVSDASGESSGVDQIRRFVSGLVGRGVNGAAVQLRADLWARQPHEQLTQ